MTNEKFTAKDFLNILSKLDRTKSEIVQDYLIKFAQSRLLNFVTDEQRNVIIYKSTSANPPIAIATQMDYVADNFDNKIPTISGGSLSFWKNKYIFSRTNFGATNLANMAVLLELLDSEIEMNIEAVFLSQASTMQGAKDLNIKNILSKKIICLDGFCDARLFSSSLSLANFNVKFPTEKEFIFNSPEIKTFKLSVSGFKNSLVGIVPNDASAVKIIAELIKKIDNAHVNSFEAQTISTVVPNRASCVFTTTSEISHLSNIIRHFLREKREKNNRIQIKCVRQINHTLVLQNFGDTLNFLNEIQQGVVSDDENGILIQNISEISGEKGQINIQILSSDENILKSQKKYLVDLCEKYNFSGELIKCIPEQKATENSALSQSLQESYIGLIPFKLTPLKTVSSAGIFSEKIKDLDVAIIGVHVENPNSTSERVLLSSLKNTALWLSNYFNKQI